MPSYPDSVPTFTAKVSGGNIDPAHVNDLQDEVNAIAAGLLNGTARLNSSGSTVARLQVTGGSTFLVRPVTPPPEAARVFLQSTLAIGSSANSTLLFLSQDFVINSSIHSTTTNPERLTPQSTGIFQFTAQVQSDSPSSGLRALSLRDSSETMIGGMRVTNNTNSMRIQATAVKRFDVAGGYVICNFETDGTSNSVSSGGSASWFAMAKL